MTSVELFTTLSHLGVELRAEGGLLHYRAPQGVLTPDLKDAMKAHKPDLLKLLKTPCPHCGATDWRETPDGGRWCRPCVLAGWEPVAAVKVHSDVLDADLWMVADDVPPDTWPTDAPVYTQAEVKILREVGGPDVLEWVHATKELFGALVLSARQRPVRPADSSETMEEGGG